MPPCLTMDDLRSIGDRAAAAYLHAAAALIGYDKPVSRIDPATRRRAMEAAVAIVLAAGGLTADAADLPRLAAAFDDGIDTAFERGHPEDGWALGVATVLDAARTSSTRPQPPAA